MRKVKFNNVSLKILHYLPVDLPLKGPRLEQGFSMIDALMLFVVINFVYIYIFKRFSKQSIFQIAFGTKMANSSQSKS